MPSDIAAGLSLLQQEQEKEQSSDTKSETDHSPSSPMVSADKEAVSHGEPAVSLH